MVITTTAFSRGDGLFGRRPDFSNGFKPGKHFPTRVKDSGPIERIPQQTIAVLSKLSLHGSFVAGVASELGGGTRIVF